MSTLIKNGRIITAEQDYNADIFIENEKVTLIGENLKNQTDKVIDAKGKYMRRKIPEIFQCPLMREYFFCGFCASR